VDEVPAARPLFELSAGYEPQEAVAVVAGKPFAEHSEDRHLDALAISSARAHSRSGSERITAFQQPTSWRISCAASASDRSGSEMRSMPQALLDRRIASAPKRRRLCVASRSPIGIGGLPLPDPHLGASGSYSNGRHACSSRPRTRKLRGQVTRGHRDSRLNKQKDEIEAKLADLKAKLGRQKKSAATP
jgi:hypothetical protein